MTIAILIFSEPSQERYTNVERLEEAARALGHQTVRLYEPWFTVSDDELLYDGAPLPKVDVVIARPNFIEEPSLHTYVMAALKKAGIPIVNGLSSLGACKNKIEMLRLFEEHALPYPKSFVTKKPQSALVAARRLGFPVIVKVAFGTFGKGVFYAPNQEVFEPIAEYLTIRDGNPMIVQEFIDEAQHKDLRVFVVGGEVVAAMERTAPEGDVRANTSNGGHGAPVELSQTEHDLALRAALAFDLDIAGVDLIRSNRGPLILEVNANPGFAELESTTGVDVARAIIRFATTRL